MLIRKKIIILILASMGSFGALIFSCRKSNASTAEYTTDLCKHLTEEEILKMPAFSLENAGIHKNAEGKVVGVYKRFDNLPKEEEGLIFLQCFKHLDTLMFTEVHRVVFINFPEYITEIESLTSLDFESAQFKSIPVSIGKLKNLKRFAITINPNIEKLPNTFYDLPLEDIRFLGTSLTAVEKQKIIQSFPNAIVDIRNK